MRVTIVLVVVMIALAAILLTANARRRAAREAAAAALERARQAQRKRAVPDVSNNLKGVTATQTMQPFRPDSPGNSAPGGGDRKAG
jgi:Tfp pilus assembly protein PilV